VVWVLAVIAIGVVLIPLGGAATEAESAFGLRVFARGLDAPVLVTQAPGEPSAHYVVEQSGRVLRLRGSRRTVFLDVRGDVTYGGEQGLLGLAFHPNYARNRLLYIGYTSDDGRNVVERFRSNGRVAVRSTRARLLSIPDPYGNHNGGNVTFGPDGLLYTSIGDGGAGDDPEDRAQDMRSRFGKLLTLDTSKRGASWKIAALGLRNPWRFSFDRQTGDLYIADVGQNTIEEVHFTPRRSPGLENYGWDIWEGSQRHEETPRGPGRLRFPVFEYPNGGDECSVTGGFVYRGKARPAERGRYIFGDYCSGVIWSLRVSGGKARGVRVEGFNVSSLTSFGEDLAGELYAVSHNGTIYRVT
jgi:glucose/arabinose dehydrogenase